MFEAQAVKNLRHHSIQQDCLLCSRLRPGIKYKSEGMQTTVKTTVDELIQYFKLTCWLHVKIFSALLSTENAQYTIKSQHLLFNFVLGILWSGSLTSPRDGDCIVIPLSR